MDNLKISVIMPNYNGEKYLTEAIESILNQTFRAFEFVIIDDGSTDNSVKIIKKYAQKDKRIKLLRNKKNLGIVKSLNKGLKFASGKYIARMDSDDISLPKRFEIQYQYLEENPDIFLLGTSYECIDDVGDKLYSQINDCNPNMISKRMTIKCLVHHPTVMFHNERGLFYRDKARYCEDRDLWLRLLREGKKMVIIPNVLLKYRIRKDSICNSKSRQQQLFIKEAIRWDKNVSLGNPEGYDTFDPKVILNNNKDNYIFNKLNYASILFKSEKIKLMRIEIKEIWRKKGFFNSGIKPPIYFLVSFMPKPIVNLAIKFLER